MYLLKSEVLLQDTAASRLLKLTTVLLYCVSRGIHTLPAPLQASRPVSGSEELLHEQEVKATCDSHWPAGSCQRAELNTLELDQREPTHTRTCMGAHTHSEKKGSRRPVRAISSPAEWANWEVQSLICSPALVAPSINSLACVYAQTFCISTTAVSVHQYQPGVCVGGKRRSSQCLTGREGEERGGRGERKKRQI